LKSEDFLLGLEPVVQLESGLAASLQVAFVGAHSNALFEKLTFVASLLRGWLCHGVLLFVDAGNPSGLIRPKDENTDVENEQGQKREEQRSGGEEGTFECRVEQLPAALETMTDIDGHGPIPPVPIRITEVSGNIIPLNR